MFEGLRRVGREMPASCRKGVRKPTFPVDADHWCSVLIPRLGNLMARGVGGPLLGRSICDWGADQMQPGAIWIIYTLMFGYPVPTHDEHEFTSRAACEIHKHSYSEQIVDAFQLVCSRRSSGPADVGLANRLPE